MRGKLLCVGLGLCSVFAQKPSAPPPQVFDENPAAQAIRLLQGSIASSGHFSPEEQADLLLDASRAALPLDSKVSEQLALQLFRETEKLAPGNYRSAMQKNSLVVLAQIDPVEAAEMYTRQDAPPQPRLSEDIRAYGTRTLFPALWARQKLACLDQILAISRWLGSTGQYPYAGISAILADLKDKDPDKANDLFGEAVSYLGKGPEFSTNTSHYVDFLIRNAAIPQPYALRVAIQKGLDAVERDEEDKAGTSKKELSFVYQVNTPKNSFEIHSQSTYLVYRLMTIAGLVDPRWPSQIREHFAAVSGLPVLDASDPVTVSAAVSSGSSSSGNISAAVGMSLARQLEALAQSDPESALAQTKNIGDPTERSIAVASILLNCRQMESSDQSNWLRKLEKTADALPSGESKLRLLVRLAQVQLATHREKEGLLTASHAFDLGEELFSLGMQTDPGKMAYTMPGFDPLLELAKDLATQGESVHMTALERIEHLRNEVLQAHAQVAYAEGMGQSYTARR